jgi:hypothetical protein
MSHTPSNASDAEVFTMNLRNELDVVLQNVRAELQAEIAEVRKLSSARSEPGRYGPKPPKPDYYDGRTDAVVLNRWLNQVDDYLAFYQYPALSDEPAKIASFYLSAHARTWWSSMPESQKADLTWNAFKTLLRSRFYPIDHERQVLSRIEKLKQRGPVSRYIESFESLRAQLTIGEQTEMRYFINGLRADLKVKAVEFLLDNPSGQLAELYQRMTAIGEVLWESRMTLRDPNAMDLSAVSKQSSSRKPAPKAKAAGRRDKSHIVCYQCNQKGHYRNECKSRPVNALSKDEDFPVEQIN